MICQRITPILPDGCFEGQINHSQTDLIARAYKQCMENTIKGVLAELFKRDVVDEDAERCQLAHYEEDDPLVYHLSVDGVAIGVIGPKKDGELYSIGVVFEPYDKYK